MLQAHVSAHHAYKLANAALTVGKHASTRVCFVRIVVLSIARARSTGVESTTVGASALWQGTRRAHHTTKPLPQCAYHRINIPVANTTVALRPLSPTPMCVAWRSRPVIQNKRVCTCPAWAHKTNCHADSVGQSQCYRAPSHLDKCHASM
jgi:hypothetical protein